MVVMFEIAFLIVLVLLGDWWFIQTSRFRSRKSRPHQRHGRRGSPGARDFPSDGFPPPGGAAGAEPGHERVGSRGGTLRSQGRRWVRCLLVPAVAGAAVAIPGVGLAAARTHLDPSGDVMAAEFEVGVTDAPANKRADIVGAKVVLTVKQLTVKVKVRRLSGESYLSPRIKTPTETYTATVNRKGRFSLHHLRNGVRVSCPNMSASINEKQDTVAVHISTACLNDPAWVRIAISFTAWDRRAGVVFGDQAFAVGGAFNAQGNPVYVYGKRLRA